MYRSKLFRAAFVLSFASALVVPPAQGEGEVFIVKDGRPGAEIVVAEKPARMTKRAAADLQEYVKKISGAELPVTNAPGKAPVNIFVGKSRFTDKLGLEVEDLKDGAYRMASGTNWLALVGPDGDYVPVEPWGHNRGRPEHERLLAEWDKITGDLFESPFSTHFRHYYPCPAFWESIASGKDKGGHPSPTDHEGVWEYDEAGTLNAVQAFLYDLGVRWYAPGEIGEVVPKLADIALPAVNRLVRPDFRVRCIQYGYSQHGLGDVGTWNLRLGFNPAGGIVGHVQLCHGLKFVMMRPEMRKAHPEIYALLEGKRSDITPCLSSELLFKKHVAYVRAMFDHYKEPMVNIDLPDGFGPGCECELCRAGRTPERGRDGLVSDLVFAYVDRVAREVYKTHPDRMVSALAYSSYRLPPEKIASLSPNLAIIWSRAEKRRTLYHDPDEVAEYQKLRGEWLAKLPSKQLIMWESYLNAEPKTCSIPAIFPRAIAEDLRGLKGISQGDTVEVYQHQSFSNFRPHDHGYPYDAFALNHLNLYVTARCWWDANLDIDALLEEYCRLYYGPAAGPMRTFIGYSEQHWPGLLKDEAGIARVLKLAEEAQAAVDPGTIYGRRVARVAEYVKPLSSLRKQLNRSRRDDVQRTRAFEVKALAGKKLDGKVDDPEYWPPTRTLYLRDAKLNRRPAPELDSWARVMRAGKDTLCFGVYCADPDMARLNQGAAGEGTVNMLKGDYVEILFETTSHSYYRIRVSPAGKMEEADMGDGAEERRWRSGADFAVHAGTNYWSLELRLPLGGDGLRAEEPLSGVSGRMPSAAFPWYINVGRQRVRAGLVERFTCAPTGSDKFDVPDRFVELMSK